MSLAPKITSTEPPPARLPKGFAIGDYVVDGWLRDGGMAAIYRAHRASDDVRVALKLQLPSTVHVSEMCARFDREAEAMRRVSGTSTIVDLYEAGALEDGRRYFVMEWIEGENLEELLDFLRNQDQPFPVRRACQIGRDIAEALATLHEHGLVHCDLKPANVMVGRGPEDADVVKVVDFGIAADLAAKPAGAEGDRVREALMGTSAYMAPEQVAGHRPTPAIDVFALGVVLYEALTGTCMPPDGWTPEMLPTIESLRRGVPPELAGLVRSCMSSEAQHRPSSAAEVAERLAGFVEQARTGELRLASSEETPIRTGGTTVTPRSEIAALEESAVRTGGTEVALTHEQVLKISGDVAVVSRVAEGGAEREGGLPTRTPGDESEDGAPSDRRWWVIAVVLVLVLAGGLWLATGEDEGEAVGEGEVAPSVAVQSRERPAAGERTVVDPTVPDHAVVPTEAAVVSEPSAAEIAGGSEAPTAVPSEEAGPAEDSSPPEPPSVAKPEPAKPKPATKPRAKGPDEATCEKKRADATAAKTRRDWTAVLKATMPRACWSGAALKLQRQRLRVEAYAETASFGPCVKEGGKSSDSQISARVRWCSKKLEQGS